MGLVAGACFADAGVDVTCVDVDEQKLQSLEQGNVPFFEPGLDELVKRNWPQRLRFSSNLAESIDGRQAVFVAVGTPPNEDGSADLSHVLKVAEDVAKSAKHELVLVLKSTVPVGTNALVRDVVDRNSDQRIMVASNPEFLKEGDAVNDFLKPDRIVVGADHERAFEILSRLYSPFNRQRNRLMTMSPKSAEIVKYASNGMLAVKISFMNDIARLCDAAGADVEDVRLAVGADKRIGYQFLYPGLGFGGSCFPKDTRALASTGKDLDVRMSVVEAAIEANDHPVQAMLGAIERSLGSLAGKTIAVWGLAFKPRTDDVREAPALKIIEGLISKGADVRATDPEAVESARAALQQMGITDAKVHLFEDEYETCEGADALVLCTEWNEFRSPDAPRLSKLMRGRHAFDGRNAWIPEELEEAGFTYHGVGRAGRSRS